METKKEIEKVEIERVDDIPVIYGLLEKMGLQSIIDEVIEPHGNWTGVSPGWLITIWLVHILTEHNHCMDRVREWVSQRLHTLRGLSGQPLTALDFTDDRLAICLRLLSGDEAWSAIEAKLGGHLMRVYRLGGEGTIRLDATTETVNHDPDKHTLFKVGKAKNGQFETQYKLMVASLDPLGLILAVDVVAGNRGDDPLYLPCYQRVKQIVAEKGLLIVGDSKMSALLTRATIEAGDDHYLTPLAHLKDEPGLLNDLLTPWLGREDELELIFFPADIPAEGEPAPEQAISRAQPGGGSGRAACDLD